MAQAPNDPYYGSQGFRTAWANAARWVTVTLPEQWDEMQRIIDYVGGLTIAPPTPEAPPPPPASPLDALSAEERALAEEYIAGLRATWQFTPTPRLCLRDEFDALPNWKLVAVESLGAVIWRDLVYVYASPPGYDFGAGVFRSRWVRGAGWV